MNLYFSLFFNKCNYILYMSILKLLNNLNKKQKKVVTSKNKNILVLAGAGSGKTKVLVHRIAWIIETKKNLSNSIMAVTFTNKAAMELKHRIKKITNNKKNSIWIGTFHSLSHRLLRIHYLEAKLPKDFQIIDTDDQIHFLKIIIKNMNLDIKKWNPKKALSYINRNKENGLRPENIKEFFKNSFKNIWLNIYKKYQESCNRTGLVDFPELLLRTYELLLNNSKIKKDYQNRFAHILIDEFQDTNKIQYEWIRMLLGKKNSIVIVGDDDQSIYGWRGAQLDNIKNFLKEFPNTVTIRLEQNYRSSNNILRAANGVIENNTSRIGKILWTNCSNGEPISLYCAFNELDEANFVIERIKSWKKNKNDFSDCAVLYRKNSQSRILEEVLLKSKVPYIIYGNVSFFQRKEIKDALAYCRLVMNKNDDIAFERIVNKPTRGIGKKTLSIIKETAEKKKYTLYKATLFLINNKKIRKTVSTILINFFNLIKELKKTIKKFPLHKQIRYILQKVGLIDMYKKNDRYSRSHIDNIEELINSSYQYILYNQHEKNIISISLQDFLSYLILEIDEKNDKEVEKDKIKLMTIHAAKGLEFKSVFIIGMEEGIFPNEPSLKINKELEEERRLAYVGITRAMCKLTLTYTKNRRFYNKNMYNLPSRFIYEIPNDCINTITNKKFFY